jgi:hypothetical protein
MATVLSKSGIVDGATVQPWHVTQSIDALTGTTAYDITISGSLTLTGSIKSLNGYTGSLFGTASWAQSSSEAISSISSSYASVAEAISGAYVPSGSVTSTSVSLKCVTGYGKIPAGGGGGGGINFIATINELDGKILGANCFITIGYSSSVSGSDMKVAVDSLAGPTLIFEYDKAGGTTATSSVDFFFNCMYLA